MAINWTTVEDAIVAWVRTGSGLASGKVIWAKQDGNRPARPYIAISKLALSRTGYDAVSVEDTPGTPDPGEEITHYARGPRRLTLVMTAFADSALGSAGAAQLLDGVVSKLPLPTVADALATAGVGVAQLEPVQEVGGLLNYADFEPRAVLTARCFLASEVSEVGTYIETVELENDPVWGT